MPLQKDSFAYLLAQVGSAFMSKGNQNLDDSDDDFDAAVGSDPQQDFRTLC